MAPALLLALCLLTQSVPRTDPVAKIEARPLTRAEYAEWLVVRSGVSALYDFVAEQVILTEADKRGMRPTPDDVAKAYEAEKLHIVEVAYGGNVARWESDLTRQGYSLETAKARRMNEMLPELALEKMIRADRDLSDAKILERFRELYGDPAERVSVEVLRFSAYRDLTPGTRPDIPALKAQSRQRADKARAAWTGGAELADLLGETDDPDNPAVVQGVIAEYRPRMLGKEIDAAISALDKPGDISQPIEVFDGTWLARLVSRETVTLEQVRDSIVAELRDLPVDSGEINLLRNALMERYKPEMLLH